MRFKITVLIFLSIVILNLSPAFSGEWTPVVTGVDTGFLGIWGSSSTDVFAVGGYVGGYDNQDAMILHFNGSTWAVMPISGYFYPPIYDVWGTAESDVFVLSGDRIIHYDGTNWSVLYNAVTYPELYVELHGIWGSSSSNVYVVGGSFLPWFFGSGLPVMPIMLHYDGVNWTKREIIRIPGVTLEGIWGSSEDDIFAVASGFGAMLFFRSRILHYDGKSWTMMKRFPSTYLYGIWGSSATDVFAVGGQVIENGPNVGVIWHYDGRQWTQMDTGQNMVNIVLNAVWGSSGENVFVGGFSDEAPFRIFHYDGSAWSAMESPLVNIESIWGSSATDIYAAGYDSNFDGVILHYDGADGGIAK